MEFFPADPGKPGLELTPSHWEDALEVPDFADAQLAHCLGHCEPGWQCAVSAENYLSVWSIVLRCVWRQVAPSSYAGSLEIWGPPSLVDAWQASVSLWLVHELAWHAPLPVRLAHPEGLVGHGLDQAGFCRVRPGA